MSKQRSSRTNRCNKNSFWIEECCKQLTDGVKDPVLKDRYEWILKDATHEESRKKKSNSINWSIEQ